MTDTEALQDCNTRREDRFVRDDNEFGLIGIDHFAMPSLDVGLMARFMQEVLGAHPYYLVGFDPLDGGEKKPGMKQAFMRVGNVLMQCSSPLDGKLTVGKDDPNPWPHWAFRVSAAGLDQNIERLRSLGIPVWGPVDHHGGDSVSAYFATPEGHKLELVTYEPYPAQKLLGVFGPQGAGTPQWPTLYHDWPNIA